jgi:hypothetical protein
MAVLRHNLRPHVWANHPWFSGSGRGAAMVVEIRHEGQMVWVRVFGSGLFNRWSEVAPGGRDELFTHRSHEELARLSDGVWEFPQPGPVLARASH